MKHNGLYLSCHRKLISDRLLAFGDDLQLWVERNLDKRYQVVCDSHQCGCNFSLFHPQVFTLYLRCWEKIDGYLGLPDNILIVASFGCDSKNLDSLFLAFHDFLMRHGKMHGFKYIAFDDTMLETSIDETGRTIAKYLNPLGYRMMRCKYAIKAID